MKKVILTIFIGMLGVFIMPTNSVSADPGMTDGSEAGADGIIGEAARKGVREHVANISEDFYRICQHEMKQTKEECDRRLEAFKQLYYAYMLEAAASNWDAKEPDYKEAARGGSVPPTGSAAPSQAQIDAARAETNIKAGEFYQACFDMLATYQGFGDDPINDGYYLDPTSQQTCNTQTAAYSNAYYAYALARITGGPPAPQPSMSSFLPTIPTTTYPASGTITGDVSPSSNGGGC